MKRSLFLLFLILISQAQHGTIVTHYDLDGNLISEEFQEAIEEETIPEYQQLYKISPTISQQPQETTSIEYQQYQQQERERQEQLEKITQLEENQLGIDQLSNQQTTSFVSDAQLNVALQNLVNQKVNIQQSPEQPINEQSVPNKQSAEQLENTNNQTEVNDMPIQQEQIQEEKTDRQEQIEDVPIVENIQTLETDSQEIENQETITLDQMPQVQQDMIATEDLEETLNDTVKQEEKMQSNKFEGLQNNSDQVQITQTAEMDNTTTQDMQSNQIEEDIQFDSSCDSQIQEIPQLPQSNPEGVDQKINDLPIDQSEGAIMQITQDNQTKNENIKQANEIQQNKCIIIYSQCDYQGYALEACDSLQQIEQFKYKIQSIYIPQGYGLTIYEKENFNGHNHRYTTSQSCLHYEVSFIQQRQNLRSRI